jgi:hypothetical protein
MSKPVERREMTPDEYKAYFAMRNTVRFLPASWDKRFFNHFVESKETGEIRIQISDKEAPQLWRLLVRYRRQWMRKNNVEDAQLLRMAERLAAPDFRKLQAAEAMRYRIEVLRQQVGGAQSMPPSVEERLNP